MKSLGRSSFFTKGGMLLVKTMNIPDLYSNISNEDRIIIGKVNDIIGPVMDPHILLRPTQDALKNPEMVIGKELFEIPKKGKYKRDKKWKKGR